MKKTLIIAIGFGSILYSCTKSSTENKDTQDCNTVPKSYATNVSPIIQSSCATNSDCHGSGSGNGPGPLTTYQQVFNNRSLIRTAVANGTMPKNSSLSSMQKSTILCWIESGAPNN